MSVKEDRINVIIESIMAVLSYFGGGIASTYSPDGELIESRWV